MPTHLIACSVLQASGGFPCKLESFELCIELIDRVTLSDNEEQGKGLELSRITIFEFIPTSVTWPCGTPFGVPAWKPTERSVRTRKWPLWDLQVGCVIIIIIMIIIINTHISIFRLQYTHSLVHKSSSVTAYQVVSWPNFYESYRHYLLQKNTFSQLSQTYSWKGSSQRIPHLYNTTASFP